MPLCNAHPQSCPPSRLRGLTLIELLMAVTILAIVTGIAMPAFASLLRSNRLVSTFNMLITSLQLARTQAVQAGTSVLVCPGDPLRGCTGSQNWQDGWIVVLRPDAHGQPDARSRILVVQQSLPPGIGIQSSRGRQRVKYQPDGSARGSNLSLRWCLPGEAHAAQALVVSNAGRPRKVSGKALNDLPPCQL